VNLICYFPLPFCHIQSLNQEAIRFQLGMLWDANFLNHWFSLLNPKISAGMAYLPEHRCDLWTGIYAFARRRWSWLKA
jgi:hypothetical protein